MKKLDENRNVTQEYLDYVSSLKREDLETFYIGADLLIDNLKKFLDERIEEYDNCIHKEKIDYWTYNLLLNKIDHILYEMDDKDEN